ncbi:MAG: ATP-binding cassette domain-containing protein [Nitratireductor sp.]
MAGESGSGKTTVARMIMGLIAPSAGSITVDGVTMAGTGRSDAFRHLTQIVYQNPGTSLNPKRTVGQTLSVPLRFAGLERARFDARIAELPRPISRRSENTFDTPSSAMIVSPSTGGWSTTLGP